MHIETKSFCVKKFTMIPKSFASIVLCSLVASTISRPQGEVNDFEDVKKQTEGGLESRIRNIKKRSIQNSDLENSTDFENHLHSISLNINTDELSDNLRCAVCLTECATVQNPMRYFLCKSCIKSCSNQTNAFMHFFTSHTSEVIPQTNPGSDSNPGYATENSSRNDRMTTSPSTTSSQRTRLGQTKSSNQANGPTESEDYFYQHVEKEYFDGNDENDCGIRRKEYKKMKTNFAQCVTDLENCNAGWPTPNAQPPSVEQSPPTLDYDSSSSTDYPEYGEYSGSPDRERSNLPPSVESTETIATDDMLFEIARTTPEMADFIQENRQFMNNSTEESYTVIETTSETTTLTQEQRKEVQRIIIDHVSMFVAVEELEQLKKKLWGIKVKTLANIKSLEGEEKRAVCQTIYLVKTPRNELHRSRAYSVEILQDEDYRQPFFYAECAYSKPTMHQFRAIPDAECMTVPVQRSAFIIVDEDKRHKLKLNDCKPFGDGKYVCKDWISVPGACSLFL